MPHYPTELDTYSFDEGPLYFVYSTIGDGPLTDLLTETEMKAHLERPGDDGYPKYGGWLNPEVQMEVDTSRKIEFTTHPKYGRMVVGTGPLPMRKVYWNGSFWHVKQGDHYYTLPESSWREEWPTIELVHHRGRSVRRNTA